mmetsp:Transcript_58276/g.161114  ORF Transcript_58276/g.161114 Transcript_58276/m.161114 type:complete len:366 (+) Transcript_58276:152-1249(+)
MDEFFGYDSGAGEDEEPDGTFEHIAARRLLELAALSKAPARQHQRRTPPVEFYVDESMGATPQVHAGQVRDGRACWAAGAHDQRPPARCRRPARAAAPQRVATPGSSLSSPPRPRGGQGRPSAPAVRPLAPMPPSGPPRGGPDRRRGHGATAPAVVGPAAPTATGLCRRPARRTSVPPRAAAPAAPQLPVAAWTEAAVDRAPAHAQAAVQSADTAVPPATAEDAVAAAAVDAAAEACGSSLAAAAASIGEDVPSFCAICLEPLWPHAGGGCGGQALQALFCGHAFHAECIGRWLHESETCPLCKSVVSDSVASDPLGTSSGVAWASQSRSSAAQGSFTHTSLEDPLFEFAGNLVDLRVEPFWESV